MLNAMHRTVRVAKIWYVGLSSAVACDELNVEVGAWSILLSRWYRLNHEVVARVVGVEPNLLLGACLRSAA